MPQLVATSEVDFNPQTFGSSLGYTLSPLKIDPLE